jgi:hypothetical protein
MEWFLSMFFYFHNYHYNIFQITFPPGARQCSTASGPEGDKRNSSPSVVTNRSRHHANKLFLQMEITFYPPGVEAMFPSGACGLKSRSSCLINPVTAWLYAATTKFVNSSVIGISGLSK